VIGLDRDAYLRRIGYEGALDPSAGVLAGLSAAQLRSVPFENLEIVPLGRPLSLEPAALIAKIVGRRRGGFCFELNGLFALLLEELGFGVERLAFQFAEEGGYGPPFDHLALRVTTAAGDEAGPAGSRWLADVGAGRNSFARPVPLDPPGAESPPQPADGAVYRLANVGRYHHVWIKEAGGEWRELYRFEPIARRLEEFSEMCRHHQTSPDSFFTKIPICGLMTDAGRIAIRGDVLTRSGPGWKEETPLPDEAALHAALREHFAIDLDLVEALGKPSPPSRTQRVPAQSWARGSRPWSARSRPEPDR
jgi:N-hydroxyarylamine O-acetyltransferase